MNPLTFEELKELLKRFDEVLLMELLSITSEDIVEMFSDRIEENQYKLMKEIDEL